MTIMVHDVLEQLLEGSDLTEELSNELFHLVMTGGVDDAVLSALLIAMRLKGETTSEITGAIRAMRSLMTNVMPQSMDLIDTCGTGGDRKGTLNISTAVAFVVAGCGMKVAKHGNPTPDQEAKLIDDVGMAFLMAPNHHAAMKHVVPVRKALKTRTIFNLLGPLSNPAGANLQLIGVYDRHWLVPFAEVLGRLGSRRAWIVHGSDGLDEITLGAPSHVAALDNGQIEEFVINPEDYGMHLEMADGLAGGDAAYNADALRALLDGQVNDYRRVVLMNAAAALVVAEKATDISEGLVLAAKSIDEGHAKRILRKLVQGGQG
jgi:anthranilate phosphoribosyltransferase